MKISTHTFDISFRYASVQEFKNHFLGRITAALQSGSDIVVFPEYASYGLAKLPDYKTKEAIARVMWTEVFPEVMKLSQTYDALICAGTAPNLHKDSGKFRNRAIIAASGKSHESYKRCLTPWEGDFEPGPTTLMLEWKGLKIANLICFDAEFPELSAELKRFSPHLILIPSATADETSMHRVCRCASARAVEIGAITVVSPLVGADESNPLVDVNVGKCAIYFPAQEVFSTQPSMESIVHSQGDHSLSYTLDPDLITRVKRMDSETKPFLKTINAF